MLKHIVKALGIVGYWMVLIALCLYVFGVIWSNNLMYIIDLTVGYNFVIANLFILGTILTVPAVISIIKAKEEVDEERP